MTGVSYCYLKTLSGTPGKMIPEFEKDIPEYNLILSATDVKTVLEVVPEHYSDTLQIINDKDDVKTIVEINEGFTKTIQIIVESEFMENSRTYTLYVTRLSSKLNFLETIAVHPGKLTPDFNGQIYHYTCSVAANVNLFKMYFEMADSRCSIEVNNDEPKSSYELNMGCTSFKIKVQSIDESLTKKYLIDVYKRENPRYVFINEPLKRLKYEDPISLSPLYCPLRIAEYDIWSVMSAPHCSLIKQLQRFNSGKSIFERKSFTLKIDKDTDRKISELIGVIPLSYGGLSQECKLANIGSLLLKCAEASPFKRWKVNKISAYPETFKLIPNWQNNLLLEEYDEDEKDFAEFFEETMIEYFFYLPNSPITDGFTFSNDLNPVTKLQLMLTCLVKEVQNFPKTSDLHLNLGYLLEEKFMLEDIMNIKFSPSPFNDMATFDSKNQIKINNICESYEFQTKPTSCQQLQALKEEHMKMINKSQITEADNIQNLYEWKSREVLEEGKIAMLIQETTNALGQAAYKYGTALSLDLQSCVKNFHVGRMLILEGKYGEAIIRLEHCLTIDPLHQSAKFLLGFAQSKLTKLTEQKFDRTIELLLEGMEIALAHFSLNAITGMEVRKGSKKLYAKDDNFFRLENPIICRGILCLAKLLVKKGSANIYMKPLHVFHIALQVACMGWVNTAHGYIMGQFEYVIIQCHYELFNLINEEMSDIPNEIVIQRCMWINAFISSSLLPTSREIIEIQEKVCQYLVFYHPCNEFYLLNLGIVLMKKAEMYPPHHPLFIEYIESSIHILKIAVEFNGKPMIGPSVPYLNELSWFKFFRIDYMTKRAPIVISESLKCLNDYTGISDLDNPNSKTIQKSKNLLVKQSTNRSDKDSLSSPINVKPKVFNVAKPNLQYHSSANTLSEKMKKRRLKKRTESQINISAKRLSLGRVKIGDKTSLFFVSKMPQQMKNKKHILKNYSSDGIAMNPPTIYSRLILARAFRANELYMESVKCYNFIRKIVQQPGLKATINKEMVELLLDSKNFEQALEVMCKVYINELKVTENDLILCERILQLLIQMNMLEDERIIRYASLMARNAGLESIKEILISGGLKHIYKFIKTKYFNFGSRMSMATSTEST